MASEWEKWKPFKRPGREGAQKLEERGDRCILCRVHYLRPCQPPVAPNPRCFSRQAQCPWRTHEAAFQKPAKNPGKRGAGKLKIMQPQACMSLRPRTQYIASRISKFCQNRQRLWTHYSSPTRGQGFGGEIHRLRALRRPFSAGTQKTDSDKTAP